MKYAVVGQDGNFTGVAYTTMTPEIKAHHTKFDQSFKLVKGLVDHEDEETGEITYSEVQMTIEESVELKRQQLKAEREARTIAPINNVQVGRTEDRENINGVIDNWESLGLTDAIEWVMADNSVQPLTKADLVAVKTGFTIRKAQCFAAYQQALEQLEQAKTAEEVLSIQLPETS